MTDDEKTYCDGEDDETPEQSALADAEGVKAAAEGLGISLEEAAKLLGL